MIYSVLGRKTIWSGSVRDGTELGSAWEDAPSSSSQMKFSLEVMASSAISKLMSNESSAGIPWILNKFGVHEEWCYGTKAQKSTSNEHTGPRRLREALAFCSANFWRASSRPPTSFSALEENESELKTLLNSSWLRCIRLVIRIDDINMKSLQWIKRSPRHNFGFFITPKRAKITTAWQKTITCVIHK